MKKLAALLALVALSASAVRADEILTNLETAKSAYQAGNYSESLQALDYAGQLIRQKKGEAVAKLLPDAPKGWTAGEVENEAAAGAIMGGFVTAKRNYTREDGTLSAQIQSDSPVLQGLMMAFANPMLATGNGGKLETIKGQRAVVTYAKDNKSGDVKIVVDGRYLVSIEGSGLTREELVQFAGTIDCSALAKQK